MILHRSPPSSHFSAFSIYFTLLCFLSLFLMETAVSTEFGRVSLSESSEQQLNSHLIVARDVYYDTPALKYWKRADEYQDDEAGPTNDPVTTTAEVTKAAETTEAEESSPSETQTSEVATTSTTEEAGAGHTTKLPTTTSADEAETSSETATETTSSTTTRSEPTPTPTDEPESSDSIAPETKAESTRTLDDTATGEPTPTEHSAETATTTDSEETSEPTDTDALTETPKETDTPNPTMTAVSTSTTDWSEVSAQTETHQPTPTDQFPKTTEATTETTTTETTATETTTTEATTTEESTKEVPTETPTETPTTTEPPESTDVAGGSHESEITSSHWHTQEPQPTETPEPSTSTDSEDEQTSSMTTTSVDVPSSTESPEPTWSHHTRPSPWTVEPTPTSEPEQSHTSTPTKLPTFSWPTPSETTPVEEESTSSESKLSTTTSKKSTKTTDEVAAMAIPTTDSEETASSTLEEASSTYTKTSDFQSETESTETSSPSESEVTQVMPVAPISTITTAPVQETTSTALLQQEQVFTLTENQMTEQPITKAPSSTVDDSVPTQTTSFSFSVTSSTATPSLVLGRAECAADPVAQENGGLCPVNYFCNSALHQCIKLLGNGEFCYEDFQCASTYCGTNNTCSDRPVASESPLSGGQIAGAVLGSLLGAAIIVAGVIWFQKRRKLAKRREARFRGGSNYYDNDEEFGGAPMSQPSGTNRISKYNFLTQVLGSSPSPTPHDTFAPQRSFNNFGAYTDTSATPSPAFDGNSNHYSPTSSAYPPLPPSHTSGSTSGYHDDTFEDQQYYGSISLDQEATHASLPSPPSLDAFDQHRRESGVLVPTLVSVDAVYTPQLNTSGDPFQDPPTSSTHSRSAGSVGSAEKKYDYF